MGARDEARAGFVSISEVAKYGGAGDRSVASQAIRVERHRMTIQQELHTRMGVLLAPKGFEVSRNFLERISTFAPELLDMKIRVGSKTRTT